jgi:hypothetical protein
MLGIFAFTCPEESVLFGRRWMYKDEPEHSEEYIFVIKTGGAIIIIIGIILIIACIRSII